MNTIQVIPVNIKDKDTLLMGQLFLPEKAKSSLSPLPLVLVAPEWWGKTEYAETRARQIAHELGYVALAVDFYGQSKTVSTPSEAQGLATPFYQNPLLGVKRLQQFIAAAPEAAKQANVTLDLSKIAAVGYCFGGTQVLNLARAGQLPGNEKLLGVVSLHGGLKSSLTAQCPIQPKILVLHGGADEMVTDPEVKTFEEEMKKNHADLALISYPGVHHAFTNPRATEIGKKHQIPIAYDAHADQDSWAKMASFLAKLLS